MYLILCWSYLNHSLRFVGEKKRLKKKSHIKSQSQYFGKKSQLDYFPKSFSPNTHPHTHSHTHTLKLTHSHSHTLTHTHTHTLKLTHSHTLTTDAPLNTHTPSLEEPEIWRSSLYFHHVSPHQQRHSSAPIHTPPPHTTTPHNTISHRT